MATVIPVLSLSYLSFSVNPKSKKPVSPLTPAILTSPGAPCGGGSRLSSLTPPRALSASSKPVIGSVVKESLGKLRDMSWRDLWSINNWVVRDYYRLVSSVNALEPDIVRLSDEQLRGKTEEFRVRLTNGETLADIQAEAFAVVREAARRKLGMRHFDVQIIGGAVLHDGCIAEMKTGEGKTLVSTLAAYLNALTGNGVHGWGSSTNSV